MSDSRGLEESRRFGLEVHRFVFEELGESTLKVIFEARPDVAIVRFPSRQLPLLNRYFPRSVHSIVADTLVYYVSQPQMITAPHLKTPEVGHREIVGSDSARLEKLIRRSFSGYTNHYVANPLFDEGAVLDGFVEWGQGFLKSRSNTRTWVTELDHKLIAFAACRIQPDFLEIVLNGVDPDFAKQGIYADLLRFVLTQAKSMDTRVRISTQSHNVAVQRVWQRAGFLLEKSLNTVHLNLLLGEATLVEKEVTGFMESNDADGWLRARQWPVDSLKFEGDVRLRLREGKNVIQVLVENRGGKILKVLNEPVGPLK